MHISSWIKGGTELNHKQRRIREIFLYFFFGGLTTLVNMASFIGFDHLFASQSIPIQVFTWRADLLDVVNTTIAWILAVLFAFVTNRSFVFQSHGSFFREMVGFFSSRIVTLVVFEIGCLLLGTSIVEQGMGIPKDTAAFTVFGFAVTYLYLVKILIAVFVVLSNYILSKVFVFRQSSSSGSGSSSEPSSEKETE